jgi:glutaredoxin
MTAISSTHSAVIYLRRGCHLCELAKEAIREVQKEFAVRIQEVDIDTDPQAREIYKDVVPVVILDGAAKLETWITAEGLRRALLARA